MNTLKKLLPPISFLATFFVWSASVVKGQVINPVIGEFGTNVEEAESGGLFVAYFLVIWNAIISIGALAVLVYFLWGAFEWITSAGDSGKLQTARNRMLHAFVGLLLLVSAYTIIGFISELLFGENFNILIPTFWAPGT